MNYLTDIGKGIKVGIINITPEQAQKMLEKNFNNRALRIAKVSQYSLDMEQGLWQLNGMPIIFTSDMELLDGQNRLTSIIRSGVSCETVVIQGVSRNAFKTIDTGANRSGGDMLSILGVPSKKAKRLAALIQKLYSFDTGRIGTAWIDKTLIGVGGGDRYLNVRAKLTNQLLIEYYNKHKVELDDVYDFCVKYEKNIISVIGFSLYLLMFYTLRKKHILDAEEFCRLLATGEMLTVTSPIYLLREKFMGLKNSKTEKIPGWHYAALTFKAWNYFRKRIPMQKLFISINEKEPVRPI